MVDENLKNTKVYDFLVVGGGIVGLATALTLLQKRPGSSLLLVEKSSHVAAEQTGHNSGVIHAGVYYKPGSMKARFCKLGAQWTRDFCDAHGIPYENTGKLIVATDKLEVERLDALYERALENELDIEMIDAKELRRREPNIRGLKAIFVKSTGIVDYKLVAKAMAEEIVKLGGEVRLSTTVTGIHESLSEVSLETVSSSAPGAKVETVYGKQIAVCGGIQADRLARMAGIDVDWQMVPFRGEYYRLRHRHDKVVSALIYPTPDPSVPFLGVHLTRMMDGTVTVGPNAVIGLSRTGYPKLSINLKDIFDFVKFPGFWKLAKDQLKTGIVEQWNSLYKPGYLKLVQKYCPQIELEDLKPYPAGIRAQAVMKDGQMVEDFMLRQTSRMLHVVNAPSPAATSSMPIADYLTAKMLGEEPTN